MTKSIRISEKVHTRLKVHVAKNKVNIIDFADWAIDYAMKDHELMKSFGDYQERINKALYPKQSSSTKK